MGNGGVSDTHKTGQNADEVNQSGRMILMTIQEILRIVKLAPLTDPNGV